MKELAQTSLGREVEEIVAQARKGDALVNPIQVDDDDVDTIDNQWAADEAEYDADIAKIESIDLTQTSEEDDEVRLRPGGTGTNDKRCAHYKRGTRNPCLCGSHEEEEVYYKDPKEPKADNDGFSMSTSIVKGQVYHVTTPIRAGRYIVDFIKVQYIGVHRQTGVAVIRGLPFTRTRNMDGRLAAYKNEVCMVLEIESNDARSIHQQCLIEVGIGDVEANSRHLYITNKPFPECRFDPVAYATPEDREHRAPLACRWIHTMEYPDKRYRRAQRPINGESIEYMREHDINCNRNKVSDACRLEDWRGCKTSRGGSYVPNTTASEIGEGAIQDPKDNKFLRRPGQKYNAADMFSGAGGFTTGAKMAGIRVERAVDHWARCNLTYKENHPEVELFESDIMVHVNDLTIPNPPVDIVHLSPPCQTWSPAHTCIGKNDPANIAALSACQHIVEMRRPRMITFEQTFGIIQERHLPYFNALVQSLTRYGYSLAWKVIPLVDFGLAQARKRLIMIGTAPGQSLPGWPSPTHSVSPTEGQKSLVSAAKACRGLVDGQGLHDVAGARDCDRAPWDGSQPMNRTITTSGGQAYHWDGNRELTLAEFAALQGFPHGYRFEKPCIKKQIGNAFPPVVVKHIMTHCRKWLEKLDDIKMVPNEDQVINLSDDDDNYGGKDDAKLKKMSRQSPYPKSGGQAAKREALPKVEPDYCKFVHPDLTEDEATVAALYESQQMYGTPLVYRPAGSAASFSQWHTASGSEVKALPSAPGASATVFGNDRPSSISSDLVILGSRSLKTIIEVDNEDNEKKNDGSVSDADSGYQKLENQPETVAASSTKRRNPPPLSYTLTGDDIYSDPDQSPEWDKEFELPQLSAPDAAPSQPSTPQLPRSDGLQHRFSDPRNTIVPFIEWTKQSPEQKEAAKASNGDQQTDWREDSPSSIDSGIATPTYAEWRAQSEKQQVPILPPAMGNATAGSSRQILDSLKNHNTTKASKSLATPGISGYGRYDTRTACQPQMSEEEQLQMAMQLSISDAVKHAEKRQMEKTCSDGAPSSNSAAAAGATAHDEFASAIPEFKNPFGPYDPRSAQLPYVDDAVYEGKGKGKAVNKRPLDDPVCEMPAKRGRPNSRDMKEF